MVNYNLAIELGTSHTVIYAAGLGIVLKEPSCIATETIKGKQVVKCVGVEAKKLIGKTNSNLNLSFPVNDGVIVNFNLAKLMLQEFLKKIAYGGFFKKKHKVVFTHSCGLSFEEKCLLRDLAYAVNINCVALVPSPVAALIGMEVEEFDPNSHLIVDLGGGLTDVAIVNNYHIIRGAGINVAGNLLDHNIGELLKQKYQIVLGQNTLEEVKNQVGSLYSNDISTICVVGLELDTRQRRELRVTSQDIYEVVTGAVNSVSDAIETILSMSTSEVLTDIQKYGIYLCGGLANLSGVDVYLKNKLDLPVYIDTDPDSSVIRGMGSLLNNQALLNKIIKQYL